MLGLYLDTQLASGSGFFTRPNPGGLIESNNVAGDYWGIAAYLDVSYAFTDQLDLSLGARYTRDTKQFANHALPVESYLGPFYGIGYTSDGFLEAERDWDDIAPRALLRFRPSAGDADYAIQPICGTAAGNDADDL